MESVAVRHWAIQVLPSWTAKRVLVLPCSMASSMSVGPEKHVAGVDAAHLAVWPPQAQGAVDIQSLGAALEISRVQPGDARLPKAVGPRRPGLGDGREAQPVP